MLTSHICSADREWVTGYSKRKTQRRKFAIKQAEEKARKERLQERKERREEMRRNLGLDKQKDRDGPVDRACAVVVGSRYSVSSDSHHDQLLTASY